MLLALDFDLLVWSFLEQIGWIKSLEIFEWNPHQIMQTVEGLQELLQQVPGWMKILKILIIIKILYSKDYSLHEAEKQYVFIPGKFGFLTLVLRGGRVLLSSTACCRLNEFCCALILESAGTRRRDPVKAA